MSWPLVKLEEIAELINGDRSSNYPSGDDIVDNGILFLNSKNIVKNKLNLNTKNFITQKKFDSLKRGKLQKKDLVITLRGTLGSCCIFDSEFNTGFINAQMMIIRTSDQVDQNYLYHFLTSSAVKAQFLRLNTGSAVPQLTGKQIGALEIPLPPLAEQKRIAAILDKADAIRQKRKQAIELADEFLRSVFLDMFGDPVTNPKGWEVKRLGDISINQLGKMLSKKAKEGVSPKKYLRNANVRWREIDFTDMAEMNFNEKEIVKFELQRGDLLVCEGGEVGRCAIWDDEIEDCYYQKALHRVRVNKDYLTSIYLQEYFYWMAKKGGLSDSVSEVTFSHLTAEKLKELKVPVPSLSLQNKFESIYSQYINLLTDSTTYQLKQDELFNALSQKAFSGEL